MLLTALMLGLVVGCSQKKQASKEKVAAWFQVAVENGSKARASSTTTTPGRVTTTIPPTTSTMPPLVRLALSKAFQEAGEARRLAEQRCQQLAGSRQRPRC
jgi:hypothetical protein